MSGVVEAVCIAFAVVGALCLVGLLTYHWLRANWECPWCRGTGWFADKLSPSSVNTCTICKGWGVSWHYGRRA